MDKRFMSFRIMHILSPVKWEGTKYLASKDSNWKVCEKTINFLPNAHHYILTPPNHDIELDSPNASFIDYDYPRSVQLNRAVFDYRGIDFDFQHNDVDFVFLHQPELIQSIQQWFSTKRYYEDVKYFGFFHWIDCNQSRGSVGGCPSFYMRQLEAFHKLHSSFVHYQGAEDYLFKNFPNAEDISGLVRHVNYMPLSTDTSSIEEESFDLSWLDGKKILVFNHRWNQSSGIDKLQQYINELDDEYVVWVTDSRCPLQEDQRYHVESLSQGHYVHLLKNAYATLCFIDGYSTWNLAAQDGVVLGTPLVALSHPMLGNVLGNYPLTFKNPKEFVNTLEAAPHIDLEQFKLNCESHDTWFQYNLAMDMASMWHDTRKPPKRAPMFVEAISGGTSGKKDIQTFANPRVRLDGSAHFIRRHLLNNGIRDDINSPTTKYYGTYTYPQI